MDGLLLLPLLAALAAVPAPRTLTVTADTRLLVIAPHPDDEILGAGGLMRRVHDLGGLVHVVYLTDGDGYPEGVRLEERGKKNPSSSDFRAWAWGRIFERVIRLRRTLRSWRFLQAAARKRSRAFCPCSAKR